MDVTWFATGARLLPFIVGAAHAVEVLCNAARGKAKQDAAVEAVRQMVTVADIAADRTLLDDAEVEHAVRATLDAYVALQNIIAKKQAAPPAP